MHSQYLQHMQTGPLGGEEAMREDDMRRRRHNELIFKTMTEEELAMERLSVNEAMRKINEARTFTTREVKPRKAWGSSNPSEASWRRWTGAPRASATMSSRRRTGRTAGSVAGAGSTLNTTAAGATTDAPITLPQQRYDAPQAPASPVRPPEVPSFGDVTARWATSRPAAPATSADPNLQYIKRLESKIEDLTATVNDLRRSQEKPAAATTAAAVPPPYKAKVETLAMRYKSNLGTLKTVYQDKKAVEAENARLQRRIAELERRRGKQPRSTGKEAAPPQDDVEPSPSPLPAETDTKASKKAARAQVRAMAVADAKAAEAEAQAESKAEAKAADTEGKGEEGKTAAADSPAVASPARGTDFSFQMTLDEDDDDGGGDFAAPPGMDEEEEEEDQALADSALHGEAVPSAPVSTYGLEPHHTKAFAERVRAQYLRDSRVVDGAEAGKGGGTTARGARAGGRVSATASRSGTSRRHGFASTVNTVTRKKVRSKKVTVPRPFVNMELRTDDGTENVGITTRKRLDEEARRKKEEEDLLKYRIPVLAVPSSTKEPLYEKLVKMQDTIRDANVKNRKRQLEKMLTVNKDKLGTLANTAKAREKWEARKKQLEAEMRGPEVSDMWKQKKREKAEREKLRAKMMRTDYKAEMEAKERIRKERHRQRAAKTLAESKLPSRMARWEKKKAAERARKKAKEDKAARRAKARAARLKTRVAKPVPFSFDTEDTKKKAAERRQKLKDKLEEEEKKKLEATRAPSTRRRGRGRRRPSTADSGGSQFTTTMTNAALKRMEYIRKQREAKEEEELVRQIEAAERKRREKAASKNLATVVHQMESERLNGKQLAWKEKPADIIKRQKREAQARPDPNAKSSRVAKLRKRLGQSKSAVASSNRPFLFQSASNDANKEKTYFRTLLKMNKAVDGDSASSDDDM